MAKTTIRPDIAAKNVMSLQGESEDPDTDLFFGHVTQNKLDGPFGAGVLVQHDCPGGEFEAPAFDDFHVNILIEGGGKTYDNFGGIVRESYARPGQIGMSRPYLPGDIAVEGKFSSIHVSLPKGIFQRTSDAIGNGRPPDFDALFEIYFHDSSIFWMAQELNRAAFVGAWRDELFMDEALWALSCQLMRRAGTLTDTQRKSQPLDPVSFKKVHDLLMECLESQVTVQDLADAVNMDAFAFSRGFKARTGRSPYQYLIQLRVDQSLHLLLSTDTSLIEIAYACGFSSQAHFTTVFRKVTGVTPGAARARR
ncbi:AraC family transcriptional regulator [uncultured Tateyamaria sp.]|uniref:helix-turn-helix domain-containing protein n=1 Tax=uncultured Tateyamaria sp. TaxID=455651 RepID=UPI002632936A|nr:AraC family transcriptional regulator [uncultured Tateyamaria sp.]